MDVRWSRRSPLAYIAVVDADLGFRAAVHRAVGKKKIKRGLAGPAGGEQTVVWRDHGRGGRDRGQRLGEQSVGEHAVGFQDVADGCVICVKSQNTMK